MSFSPEDFRRRAEEVGRPASLIERAILYALDLQNKGLPVIFTPAHFHKHFDEFKSAALVHKRQILYKHYEIKKKNGGSRQLLIPLQPLKWVQEFILKNILDNISYHPSAHGFVRGRSILTNARPHSEQPAILKLDLFKFFDTITEKRVFGAFNALGYAPNLAVELAQLTTCELPSSYLETLSYDDKSLLFTLRHPNEPGLAQGAPTSPAISNIIAFKLDCRLSKLAEKLGLQYTRYADDITFSGKKSALPNKRILREIIESEGFIPNWEKYGVYQKGIRQMVTGLTVSNGIHVPRKYVRELQKHLFACNKFGVINHLNHIGRSESKLYREWLLGRIMFIKSIEPEKAKVLLNSFRQINWIDQP